MALIFKSEIVFVRILFPYSIGIYFADQFLAENHILLAFLITLFLFLALLIINVFYPKLKAYHFKAQIGLFIIAFWFVFGVLNTSILTPLFHNNYFGKYKAKQIRGWIANEPQLHKGILRFELNVNGVLIDTTIENATGKLSVALKIDNKHPLELQYGNALILMGNITPIEPPYNPGEFNYRKWLASKHIYQQVFLYQNQLIQLKTRKGHPIIDYAISLRKQQVNIYRKLIRNDEAFAVASTLVLGYRADLSKETLLAYSKTGTVHALSVSGMHVGIIYIFLNWALFFLDRNKVLKTAKLLLICTLIWYYALLTGFSPSVLRSAVMLTVYIVAKSFHKNSNSYNILAFTAFCLLLYDPLLIWDVGFQLSFLAVFGLVYLQPKISNWFYISNKWIDKLWSIIALSLAAQIATFPLSIYYFHQFPLYFIFSNLFILLPLTALVYLGISILLFKLYFLAPVFEWIITFTNQGLQWISQLPYAGIKANICVLEIQIPLIPA